MSFFVPMHYENIELAPKTYYYYYARPGGTHIHSTLCLNNSQPREGKRSGVCKSLKKWCAEAVSALRRKLRIQKDKKGSDISLETRGGKQEGLGSYQEGSIIEARKRYEKMVENFVLFGLKMKEYGEIIEAVTTETERKQLIMTEKYKEVVEKVILRGIQLKDDIKRRKEKGEAGRSMSKEKADEVERRITITQRRIEVRKDIALRLQECRMGSMKEKGIK